MRNLYSNRGGRNDVVRVLVVDDHALFAEALMLTLGIDERIEVVGSASSGVEGVSLAEALRPDVVLMDVHMPSMDGIEATRRVRRVSPSTRVVMVTAARSPQIAFHALAAGPGPRPGEGAPGRQPFDAALAAPPTGNPSPPRPAR